jgi:hypothetical protein
MEEAPPARPWSLDDTYWMRAIDRATDETTAFFVHNWPGVIGMAAGIWVVALLLRLLFGGLEDVVTILADAAYTLAALALVVIVGFVVRVFVAPAGMERDMYARHSGEVAQLQSDMSVLRRDVDQLRERIAPRFAWDLYFRHVQEAYRHPYGHTCELEVRNLSCGSSIREMWLRADILEPVTVRTFDVPLWSGSLELHPGEPFRIPLAQYFFSKPNHLFLGANETELYRHPHLVRVRVSGADLPRQAQLLVVAVKDRAVIVAGVRSEEEGVALVQELGSTPDFTANRS